MGDTMRMIIAAVLLAWTTIGFAQPSSDDQLIALREALREATEALKRTQNELVNTNSRLTEIEKRLTEAESALNKERNDPTSNTVHGIRIKTKDSWRHANGTI